MPESALRLLIRFNLLTFCFSGLYTFIVIFLRKLLGAHFIPDAFLHCKTHTPHCSGIELAKAGVSLILL